MLLALEHIYSFRCSTELADLRCSPNRNVPKGLGTNIFQNMSRLDAAVNQIYHIIQTHWTQMSHEYAIQNQTVYDQPVMMTNFPHQYVVQIHWTPTTWIGLVLSLLITLNAYILAARWLWATYRFGFDSETWNLLRPIDLMAYSLATYRDLIDDLNTVEHRRTVMRGGKQLILHSAPMHEGTESLRGLVKSSTMQSPVSATSTDDPFGSVNEKVESPISDAGSPVGTFGSSNLDGSHDEEKNPDTVVEAMKPPEERIDQS